MIDSDEDGSEIPYVAIQLSELTIINFYNESAEPSGLQQYRGNGNLEELV